MDYESIAKCLGYPTQEEILDRMLDRISPELSTRESDFIYSALAPASVEFYQIYFGLITFVEQIFADTAGREFLVLRAKERGLEPYPATHAEVKIVTTPASLEVPLGTRFNYEDLNYKIVKNLSAGEYQAECEQSGEIGNKYEAGRMTSIDYVMGLETATLHGVVIRGTDEEGTEKFRARYMESFDPQAFGGNKADYIAKTNTIQGVGATKVIPVWNGGGTVKVVILDTACNTATPELIQHVQDTLDPTQDAEGVGLAPIGHIVTVDTAEEVRINIVLKMSFEDGFSFEELKPQIEEVLKDYFLDLRCHWGEGKNTIVRVSQIETRLLEIPGVIDVMDTKLNNGTANLVLSNLQVPKVGSVTHE